MISMLGRTRDRNGFSDRIFSDTCEDRQISRLRSIGVSGVSLAWFVNYLRVQCLKSENLLSQLLPVTKGVPQVSILGPTLFSICINIAQAVGSSLIHLYADDSLIVSWPLPGVCVKCSTTKLS
jgi:hypothetical protein